MARIVGWLTQTLCGQGHPTWSMPADGMPASSGLGSLLSQYDVRLFQP